jgi:hypothetical protein
MSVLSPKDLEDDETNMKKKIMNKMGSNVELCS